VYVRPELDQHRSGGSVYRDGATGALVFFRRDRALAVGFDVAADATCGTPGSDASALGAVVSGIVDPRPVDLGTVDGALLVRTPVVEACLLVAFGRTPEQALARLAAARPAAGGAFERRVEADRARIAATPLPAAGAEDAGPLLRRSLLVCELLADRETGGIIAAPELDPHFTQCGGYGFVWGRDLAFICLALVAAGRRDLVERALEFTLRTQSPEGLWLHRHWVDGSLAPSWGLHQVDETGATLHLYGAVLDAWGDEAVEPVWEAAARGARFLMGFLDPATGLPLPSVDLWEERQGQSAFAAAAAYGGLSAVARIAARRDPELARACSEAAQRVRRGIDQHLWSEAHGRFLRSRLLEVPAGEGDGTPWPADALPYPNRPVLAALAQDASVDVSLLGLLWPFGAVPAGDPRMQRTIDAVERTLTASDGGLLRYEDDRYAGGNPWVLATLWLGLARRASGDRAGWQRALRYALDHATPLGLLPEQVSAADGSPAWVLPLTWSHAMLILAALP
jgi:GH15 family glucan-1,4-alpha-glucosidase